MNPIHLRAVCIRLALAALATTSLGARAQLVIDDTLTGASSNFQWQALHGACLTAGNGTGSIPACAGLPYYTQTQVGGDNGTLPDAVGKGALRLTDGGNAGTNQRGAVVSKFAIPSNTGIEVTFTTVTYGGNGYVNTAGVASGADGMSFFLADAALNPSNQIGGIGGNLGYTCAANDPAEPDGLLGGYIGLGIDEFGNFSADTSGGSGPGIRPGRISLRGAGNITWSWLHANYPQLYPTSVLSDLAKQREAVKITCAAAGSLWDFSKSSSGVKTTQPVLGYAVIPNAFKDFPAGQPMFSQQNAFKPKRSAATPITYALQLTQNGLLSVQYSYGGGVAQPLITNQSIQASNGPLPANFRFGFAAATGNGTNVHEIMCFKAAPTGVSASSAGINMQQSSKVQVGSQIYLGFYHPINSWGQFVARNLVADAAGVVSIDPVANWDGSCVLTGGNCAATNGTNVAQSSADRAILSWDGSSGIPLDWSKLTPAQRLAIDANPTLGEERLAYLRGKRSNEIGAAGPATGAFRVRTGVLGDIVNSGATWVGAPALPYGGPWKDALNPSTALPEGVSYKAFAAAHATRTNVVYAGANDGLLHGFRAGAYDANGKYDTSAPNDGKELLAYMPAAVVDTIHSTTDPALDFSSPQYAHNAYVDATAATGDLYYQGAWHTWLVGGLGAGGNAGGVIGDTTSVARGALYAMDVTSPAQFSEANAGSLVLGEWNSSNLSCVGDTPSAPCKDSLGSVYGTPIIRRLHDGNWAVIFGNGLNSKTGKAGVFIMTVDQTSGAKSFRFLDAGAGPTLDASGKVTARNGIVQVVAADLDTDHVADYLYAGDVLGNVWRFDLTDTSPGAWAVRATPIFKTGGRPITTALTVSASVPASGAPRLMLGMGTGQILPRTLSSPAKPIGGGQSLFGIWDADLAAWNARSSKQYRSHGAAQTVPPIALQPQATLPVAYGINGIAEIRTVNRNPVCWADETGCKSGNNDKFGWVLRLTGVNEQVVFSPTIEDGNFVVSTSVPAVNQILSCTAQPAAGFTMAISPDTGGAPEQSYFADVTSGFSATPGFAVAGLGLSAVGSPSFVTTTNGQKYLVSQSVSGKGVAARVLPSPAGKGGRLTFIQRR